MWSTRVILLVGHVLAAVLLVGPATVAASAFPRQVRAGSAGEQAALGAARAFHRITRSYGTASVAVGAVGVALAAESDWWSATWLQVAIALYIAGLAVLLGAVVPLQGRLLAHAERAEPVAAPLVGRLHAATGAYAMSWLAVLVLMVAKPW
ncbi:MAG: hypothetical protein S0880_21500 [Actinomycetota bacterium]|nr:hypothetical protein [Actinomycetota bacterium]